MTNDDLMWRFASGDDSVSVPLGLSSPHDGYLVGNPRDGHHEAMTSHDDGIPSVSMVFPGRTVMDERFAHDSHAKTPVHGRSHSLSGSMGDSPRGPAEYVAHGVPCVQQGIVPGTPQSPAGSNMQQQQGHEKGARNEAGGVQSQGRGGCENTMIVVMLILHPKYTPNHNNHRPISRSKRGRRWPIFKIWFLRQTLKNHNNHASISNPKRTER